MSKIPNGKPPTIDPNELVLMGLDVECSPDHPLYDPDRLGKYDELRVLNFMSGGVNDAVKVCKTTFEAGTKVHGKKLETASEFLVVSEGRRRTINAREADRRLKETGLAIGLKIKYEVIQGDAWAQRLVMIANNQHRENWTLVELARHAVIQWKRTPDIKECSTLFNVTPQHFNRILKFDENASPEVRKARTDGLISDIAALQLSELKGAEQNDALAEAVKQAAEEGGKVTIRIVDNIVAGKRKARAGVADADKGRSPPPTKKMVRSVLEALEAERDGQARVKGAVKTVEDEFISLLRWILDGKRPPSHIEGPVKAMKEAAKKKLLAKANRAEEKASKAEIKEAKKAAKEKAKAEKEAKKAAREAKKAERAEKKAAKLAMAEPSATITATKINDDDASASSLHDEASVEDDDDASDDAAAADAAAAAAADAEAAAESAAEVEASMPAEASS